MRLIFSLILVFIMLGLQVEAGSIRFATLEWQEIDNTSLYETELLNPKTKETKYFKSKSPKMEIQVVCGRYKIKMRSYDKRGAPGPWGIEKDLIVPPAAPKPISPADKAEVTSPADEEIVSFQWEALDNTTEYELSLKNIKSGETQKFKTSKNTMDVTLKVGLEYSWKVQAFSDTLIGDDLENPVVFLLKGAKLRTPHIDVPSHGFVTRIDWEDVPRAQKYDVHLLKKEGSDWKLVFEDNIDATGESLGYKFPSNFPGGTYKFQIRATGEMINPSNLNEEVFTVRNGDRSRAAYESFLFKSSLEMVTDKYFVASYLITDITYQSHYIKTDVDFKALGGTGRLGVGKKKPNEDYGTYGIVDLSGFIIDKKNHLFKSGEFHGFYRFKRESVQLRISGGIFLRDLPEIRGGQVAADNQVKSVSVAGPQIGFEFWRAYNARYGFQFNTRYYYAVLPIHLPGDTKIVPSHSFQIGALGSYRISPRAIGLAGYAFRKDQVSYKAVPGERDNISNVNASGDEINSIAITGHYLNLILEIGF
jgi:hypothetical protein